MAMFLSRIKKALNLGTKNITVNGTYNASSDGYDGYSSVEVNVAGVTPTPVTPSNASPAALTSGSAVSPTANGYAIESYTSLTPASYSKPVYQNRIYKMEDDGYVVDLIQGATASDSNPPKLDYMGVYTPYPTDGYLCENAPTSVTPSNANPVSISNNGLYYSTANGELISGLTPITPSNSTPVSLSSGSIYKPSASGYAISSYSSKTPSDSSPASVSSGAIIKASASGYLYATQQPKVKIGTATLSTSATTKITCGFKPKYIAFVNYKDNTHFNISIYNEDVSAGYTYRAAVNGSNQNCAAYSLPTSSTSTNVAKILSTDSTGFTVDKTSTTFNTNAWYVAIG